MLVRATLAVALFSCVNAQTTTAEPDFKDDLGYDGTGGGTSGKKGKGKKGSSPGGGGYCSAPVSNTDYPGNDLEDIYGCSDVHSCASNCLSTAGCRAYSFDSNNNRCYLKTAVSYNPNTYNRAGWFSAGCTPSYSGGSSGKKGKKGGSSSGKKGGGKKGGSSSGKKGGGKKGGSSGKKGGGKKGGSTSSGGNYQPAWCSVIPSTLYTEASIEEVTSIFSLDSCHQVCIQDSRCHAYTYSSQYDICYLKAATAATTNDYGIGFTSGVCYAASGSYSSGSSGKKGGGKKGGGKKGGSSSSGKKGGGKKGGGKKGGSSTGYDTGYDTGSTTGSCTSSVNTLYPNYDLVDIATATPEICASACLEVAACHAYTHVAGRCYLKASGAQNYPQAAYGATSGVCTHPSSSGSYSSGGKKGKKGSSSSSGYLTLGTTSESKTPMSVGIMAAVVGVACVGLLALRRARSRQQLRSIPSVDGEESIMYEEATEDTPLVQADQHDQNYNNIITTV